MQLRIPQLNSQITAMNPLVPFLLLLIVQVKVVEITFDFTDPKVFC